MGNRVAGLVLPDALFDAIVDELDARMQARNAERLHVDKWGDHIRGAKRAATYMGCSAQRIYDLAGQRRLAHSKDGTVLVFRRADLDQYLEAHRRVPDRG